ncbi:MAG: Gfo/Idh/MocA family oxidoreductase [Saprospiraceae bacterium]|nr:Gfo/Idh/MocA family oxidoreductase [Saprospiraceae bacterium]
MKTAESSSPSPVRWGIIGLGKIAHKFAQDLSLVPNAQLTAVASRSQEKANDFAAQHGASHAFGDYQSLFTSKEIDIVYIATPHTRHFENTMQALASGVAVLCEKPFGLKYYEVEQMIEEARSKNVFLMEAMWTRFFPLIQKALDIVENGEIGQIKTIRADFGFHATFDPSSRVFDKGLGGGSLMDVGIYPLFLSLLVLGIPESIDADAAWLENGVDESCFMLLHYPNGAKAQLYSSISTKTEVEATILGEQGSLKLESRFQHPTSLKWGAYYANLDEAIDDYPGFGYHYEIAHVSDCIQKGLKESPLMTHALSQQLIQLLDAVKEHIGLSY